MDTPVVKKPIAWQPVTPRGVARFASASLGRLLLVQFGVALLAASTAVWFLSHAWFPAIDEAVSHLPDQGEIRSGKLDWQGDSPAVLAGRRFLAISVDLDHQGTARSPADVQIEFGRTDAWVSSMFGASRFAYPTEQTVVFNRRGLVPWWGAWKPPLLGIIAGSVIVGLMVSWAVLATLYCGLVRLVAFFSDRDLNWRQSWRLAGAALMPGALLFIAAIIAYGLGVIGPLEFCLAAAAHFVLAWAYLLISPVCLPSNEANPPTMANPFSTLAAPVNANPFSPPPASQVASAEAKPLTEAPRTSGNTP